MSEKSWIQTFTGKRFEPLNPDPAAICIEDIAHALSNICRYTGHVQRFYSVAEHSVWVSRVLKERTGLGWLARWGLLHDSTEAYIADVSRPLKHLPAFEEYRKAELSLQRVIMAKFGLPTEEPAIVKLVDAELLGTEVDQLMKPLHPDWAKTTEARKISQPIEWIQKERLGLEPKAAENAFIQRFYELNF